VLGKLSASLEADGCCKKKHFLLHQSTYKNCRDFQEQAVHRQGLQAKLPMLFGYRMFYFSSCTYHFNRDNKMFNCNVWRACREDNINCNVTAPQHVLGAYKEGNKHQIFIKSGAVVVVIGSWGTAGVRKSPSQWCKLMASVPSSG